MALMQITLIPLGTGTASVGDQLAPALRVLAESGLPYEVGDMGTVCEGPAEALLDLAKRLHASPFAVGCDRVVTHIVLDDRRDMERGLGDKRQALLRRLGDREQR